MNYKMKLDPNINYFVTADLHFFHKNILRFSPKTRPWGDIDEMREALIKEWNKVVPPDGVVFFLGDFSFAGGDRTREVIERLNGTIIWVLGNHDKVIDNQISSPYKVRYLEVQHPKAKIIMSHYPMRSWNQQGRGAVHLHGHCHGNLKPIGRMLDVGYDNLGYIARLDNVVNKLVNQPIYAEDHHA